MSLPRYPKYKDSGVEWLGDVPTHWRSLKLGHLLKSAPCYGVLVPDFEQDGVPMLRIMDMESGNADRASLTTISHSLSAQYSRTIVQEGDVVVSVVGTIGKAFQVDADLAGVNLSRAVARLQLDAGITAEFTCWIFQSLQFKRYVDMVCVGTAQRVLNMADLTAFQIVIPSLSEQTQVTQFLHRETAKIDAMIAEQQRLIGLLREKRQAVISHAVTKGLNSSAPMKPSEIEWLGDVPAHWKVCLLKRAFRSVDYGVSNSLEVDGEVAILRMGNIEDGKVMLTDLKYVSSVDSSLLLMPEDLLYNRTNSLDHIGKVGLFRGNHPSSISFASYLVRLRTTKDCYPGYFSYLLNTSGVLGLARASAFVAIGQCNLNPTRYGQITVPIPPRDEQVAISRHLDAETARHDQLINEASRAIDLLQERRSALISAAVTGQIDVRSVVDRKAA